MVGTCHYVLDDFPHKHSLQPVSINCLTDRFLQVSLRMPEKTATRSDEVLLVALTNPDPKV